LLPGNIFTMTIDNPSYAGSFEQSHQSTEVALKLQADSSLDKGDRNTPKGGAGIKLEQPARLEASIPPALRGRLEVSSPIVTAEARPLAFRVDGLLTKDPPSRAHGYTGVNRLSA
jgi:hypothetical protein